MQVVQPILELFEGRSLREFGVPIRDVVDASLHRPLYVVVALISMHGCVARLRRHWWAWLWAAVMSTVVQQRLEFLERGFHGERWIVVGMGHNARVHRPLDVHVAVVAGPSGVAIIDYRVCGFVLASCHVA